MAFLGLRTTEEFITEEQPLDWLRTLFLLYPNGMTPLTAIFGMLGSKGTGSFQINWFEKAQPTQRIFINNGAGYNTAATSLVVDDGSGTAAAYEVNQGTLLLNERTDELMIVTADPAADNTIVVSRSWGSVAAAAINDDDALHILGAAYEEGAGAPSQISGSLTPKSNYCQIFKKSLEETRRALTEDVRTSTEGNYPELKRECLQRFGLDIEKCLLWGEAAVGTGPTGKPLTTMGGLLSFIPDASTNVFDVASDNGGALDETYLYEKLEPLFTSGGGFERLGICGGTFARSFALMINDRWAPTMIEKEFGIRVYTYETPFGVLHLKTHPLWSQHPVWRQNCMVLDMNNGKMRRHLQAVTFRQNVQDNDADLRKDFFQADLTIQDPNASTDGLFTGVSTFAPG